MKLILSVFTILALIASSSFGTITITQGTSAPTYDGNSITFDEPGVPTGVSINPFDFYQASNGVSFGFGDGGLVVADDWDASDFIAGGNGTGNQLAGTFGVRMLFEQDLTALSFQGWADGSPSFPFGGINVFLINDGDEQNPVATYGGTAPFGGAGDEWFNIVADGGDVFDEVRFFNGAFNSRFSYVDNLTFNTVPEPQTFGLMGIAMLALLAVRRSR